MHTTSCRHCQSTGAELERAQFASHPPAPHGYAHSVHASPRRFGFFPWSEGDLSAKAHSLTRGNGAFPQPLRQGAEALDDMHRSGRGMEM